MGGLVSASRYIFLARSRFTHSELLWQNGKHQQWVEGRDVAQCLGRPEKSGRSRGWWGGNIYFPHIFKNIRPAHLKMETPGRLHHRRPPDTSQASQVPPWQSGDSEKYCVMFWNGQLRKKKEGRDWIILMSGLQWVPGVDFVLWSSVWGRLRRSAGSGLRWLLFWISTSL